MTIDPPTFSFGPFQLHPARRMLCKDGIPVQIGGRAFDVLSLLLERAGAVVSKEELMARAWPRGCVEESNLRVHISALRKLLAQADEEVCHINNVAGRGYSFVGSVSCTRSAPSTLAWRCPAPPLIGRDEALAAVSTRLATARLLTITGPGGVGKTALALAVADQVAQRFPDGVCMLELGNVLDPALLDARLAAILGLPACAGFGAIATRLRTRQLLLLLDGCEHLREAPAALVARLTVAAPALTVLATSREALGAPGECVYMLPPLALAPQDGPLDATTLRRAGAPALFVERAAGVLDPARLGPPEMRLVAEICRRLDGLPLAIELAAARVAVLGLHGVASGLDDSLALLSRSRPGGEPRHQSMHTVLDWSYSLLGQAEQRMLYCLSVYRGTFSVDCARAVAGPDQFDAANLYDLAARSLLECDFDGADVSYRMLETTRLYAAQQLVQSGESAAIARAHALRCVELMHASQREHALLDTDRWRTRYAQRIADVRAALDWCFGAQGDIQLGVRLTGAATLLWSELALLDEQRALILRALAHVREPKVELTLQATLGRALVHLDGPSRDAVTAFSRALALARAHGDGIALAETYSGLCMNHLMQGHYPQAMALCHSFAPYRRPGEHVTQDVHDRMMALTLHFHGQQRQARFHAERVHRQTHRLARGMRPGATYYQAQVASAAVLARIRWITGHAEEAAALASDTVELALEAGQPAPLCMALALAACPIALWNDDSHAAKYFAGLLWERSLSHGLTHWRSWAAHFQTLSEGGYPPASVRLQPGPQAETIYTIVPGLAGPADFARVGQGLSGWCAAELTRQKAIWMRTAGRPAAQADALLLHAAATAQAQGALAWLLRIALTRAYWWEGSPREDQALQQLSAILKRFPQGYPSRDRRDAQALLDAASGGGRPGHPPQRTRDRHNAHAEVRSATTD